MDLARLDDKFDVTELEIRPGTFSEKNNSALVLVYVKLKPIEDRLDEVCGKNNWDVSYEEGPLGGIIAVLGIRSPGSTNSEYSQWTHKSDGAENTQFEAVKGGMTDAFKRVARRWGIGRYLHTLPTVWVDAKKSGKYVNFIEKDDLVILRKFEKTQPGCLVDKVTNGNT